MKKYILFAILFISIPFGVSAVKLDTNIIGNKEVTPGSNVVYTVIVDQPLNNYKAEIVYDRDVLNLVDITEVNINTTTKQFEVDKSSPVIVNVTSEEVSDIVYMLEFKVKNRISTYKTEVEVKTLLAKTTDEEFSLDDNYTNLNIVEEDVLFEEEQDSQNNYLNGILNDIKIVLKNYGDPILYGSVILNFILLIILIINIRRKRVDYDF